MVRSLVSFPIPQPFLLLSHSIMPSRPSDSWITNLTATMSSVSSVPSPSISTSGNTGSTTARFVTLGSRMVQGGSGSGTEGEYDGGGQACPFVFV